MKKYLEAAQGILGIPKRWRFSAAAAYLFPEGRGYEIALHLADALRDYPPLFLVFGRYLHYLQDTFSHSGYTDDVRGTRP